jgi:hypothetical protein
MEMTDATMVAVTTGTMEIMGTMGITGTMEIMGITGIMEQVLVPEQGHAVTQVTADITEQSVVLHRELVTPRTVV